MNFWVISNEKFKKWENSNSSIKISIEILKIQNSIISILSYLLHLKLEKRIARKPYTNLRLKILPISNTVDSF